MAEVIFYERRESRLESFPAENYVDYMTNVMPLPETHMFYLPSRRKTIICEVQANEKGVKNLVWKVEERSEVPKAMQLSVDVGKIDEILTYLTEGEASHPCELCYEVLGKYLKFYK
jgi:hypothetical protein